MWIEKLSALAPLGALAVFAWGVYQFYRSNELSFRKPYWEKQLQLYEQATSAAALLASSEDEAAWQAALQDFWRLYLGPLCLVEDRAVEQAMVEMGALLGEASFATAEREALQNAALTLAVACRESVRRDWRMPLQELSIKRSQTP